MTREQGRTGFFASLAFMPDPHKRPPITLTDVLTTIVPAYVAFYIMARLVVTPGTKVYRRAFLPIALVLTFNAGTTYDFAGGDDRAKFRNFGQCVRISWVDVQLLVSNASCESIAWNLDVSDAPRRMGVCFNTPAT